MPTGYLDYIQQSILNLFAPQGRHVAPRWLSTPNFTVIGAGAGVECGFPKLLNFTKFRNIKPRRCVSLVQFLQNFQGL